MKVIGSRDYLEKNGISVPNHKIFVCINRSIIIVQIIAAVISFVMWINI